MSKSKKRTKKGISKRNGITLIILLAVMILIVNIVTLSYSWYEPGVKTGTGMSYVSDVQVRSEKCAIIGTFPATENAISDASLRTGNLVYNTDDLSNAITTASVPANRIYYFRTVIANNDETASSNISLYLKDFPANASLGVAYPSNSYHSYSAAAQDVNIVRNAHIFGNMNDDYSKLTIDWFVKTGDTAVTVNFNPTNNEIYISYN